MKATTDINKTKMACPIRIRESLEEETFSNTQLFYIT